MSHRLLRRGLLGVTLAAAAAGPAFAQFPDRAVRLVVPFAAGGTSDAVSRILAGAMAPLLGQPVLADNRPGAGGNVAAYAVAGATPDGHTLLATFAGVSSGINAVLYRRMDYDWERDFVPVGMFCTNPNVIVVHRSIPATTLPEFIAWVRAHPDELNHASFGVATNTHLSMELLARAVGLSITHVNYRQSAQAVTDLLAGRVHARVIGVPEAVSLRENSAIRVLAVTSANRIPAWPELPAVSEFVPGFDAVSYNGLIAPARTPDAAIARLNDAMNAAVATAAVQEAFRRIGAEPAPRNSPEEFATFTRVQAERWVPLVRSLNIPPE